MMFNRCRASPKHCYDIIEVDYGGWGHRTRLRDPRDQLLCLQGVPPSPYIKEWRSGPTKEGGAPKGGSPTPTGSRTPLFPIMSRRGKEEEGGRKEKGGRAPSQFGLGLGAPPPWLPPPLFHHGPLRPIYLPGGFDNLPVLRYYINLSRNHSGVQT